MQAIIIITPQQGIAAAPVDIKTRATGHEHLAGVFLLVKNSFKIPLPNTILMQFVKNQEWRAGGESIIQDTRSVVPIIPVQIIILGVPLIANRTGQRRFAHLPRTADKNHFFL